ncbi:MAG: L-histidine N(alpha)-methyltransferase [Gammaproteobacteria bacterium]
MNRLRSNPTNPGQDAKQREFMADVIAGLSQTPKSLPSKYFYDERGSQLFERICGLEEYYLTRVEMQLLTSIREELAALIGPNAAIIEPGAGAGIKIQILLEALESPALYAPWDISEEFLLGSVRILEDKFPLLPILPLAGDFMRPVKWHEAREVVERRVVFFPGSTLGNFDRAEAVSFLRNMRGFMGARGFLILGVDMVKPVEILEVAYDDREGVTEAFNKNLLLRINKELGANFDPDLFAHKAFFNASASRIEMHLESRINQEVKIDGYRFRFRNEERIHTENCHKFTLKSIHDLARSAGLVCRKFWLDDDKLFSIHLLESEHGLR